MNWKLLLLFESVGNNNIRFNNNNSLEIVKSWYLRFRKILTYEKSLGCNYL